MQDREGHCVIWSYQMDKAKWLLIIVVCVFGIVGYICWRPNPNKMPLIGDSQEMRREIIKRIPIGAGISQAQSIMKANGFQCTAVRNESFVECNPNGVQKYYAPTNFLYCDESDLKVFSRRWQVAIVDKQGIVSDVHVSISLDSL